MPPQPLSNTAFYRNQGQTKSWGMITGPLCFQFFPILAQWIARIIESSAWLEAALAESVITMLGSHAPAAMAMYGELTSTAAQASARAGAAKVILKPRDLDMFEIVHKMANFAIGQRNTIAHGLWGMSQPAFPNALFLLDRSEHLANMMSRAAIGLEAKAVPQIPIDFNPDASRLFVYEEKDFKEVHDNIAKATSLVQTLTKLVDPKKETNDGIYQQLLAVPEIREALSRLEDRRRKKLQEAQPSQPQTPDPQSGTNARP